MKPVKTIAAVGVQPELLQELQDAVTAAERQLDCDWRWGSEQNPDLLVVDPADFAARMARTRAQVTGVRYVVVGDAAKHADDRFVLLQPFRKDAVAAVLNAAGAASVAPPQFLNHDHDFYTADLETADAHPPGVPLDVDTRTPHHLPGAAPGLDEMIRGDPIAGPVPNPAAVRVPQDASVESTGPATQRTLARREQSWDRTRSTVENEPDRSEARISSQPPGGPALQENTALRLPDYLQGDLLGGPVRIEAEGLPSITLDPKQRLFHADADLPALEPWCRRSIRRSEWRAVTSAELAQARARSEGRPYSDLLWLDALLRSEGRLASHLDPGGSYRVLQPVRVDPGYHAHGAIASAMATQARLHEIAAAAQAPMERVFDVVNAYDAVGLLQWTPRPPRHAAPEPARERTGLLARLRDKLRPR